MKKLYPFLNVKSICFFFAILLGGKIHSQCAPCGAVTFTVNLTPKADTAWTQNGPVRSGTCCSGTGCVKFVVFLNPGSDLLSFNVTNPAPSGSAFYQINCGPQVSIGTPACIPGGQTSVCITYCKPGGDSPIYHITASKTVKSSNDFTVRVGCAGTMTVGGLSIPSITWTSIAPGTPGLYNSYLSCSVACASTTVTPSAATPTLISYKVSGSPLSGCPGTNADTINVTIVPGMTVAITPTNPVVCSGGSSTIALTASAVGGQAPYTFTWSTGANTSTIGAAAGNYTVLINDNTLGCSAFTKTITVTPITTPTAPTITSNSPLCAGQTLNLSASNSGSTYNWTGPNGFTSTLQNPVIALTTTANAGTYMVTSSFSGCTGPAGSLSVTVNPVPGTPTLTSNSPICAGQNLNLTSNFISGATYNWTGPNGFTSTLQNPTLVGVSTLAAGAYSLIITNNACASPMGIINVTVNTTPAPPTPGSNSPICAGQTLSLTASPGGFLFNWTGPNGFTSTSQNPTLAGATTAASGIYSVTAAAGTCVSSAATISVTVNPIPAAPTPGSNSPVCSGQNINLTGLPNGAAAYNWTGPNGFSSSTQNPSVVGASTLATGAYSLIITVSGCNSPVGIINVVVNQTPLAPVAASNGPLCAGATLNLTASSTGVTYSWSGPNGFTSVSQNPSLSNVTTAATGIYSVTAAASGCTGTAGTISVTVNPIPVTPTATNNSTLCAGQTLNLTAAPNGAASYSWTGPNGFTSTTQNPSIAGVTTAASGVYSVTQVVNGCTSLAGTTTATINPIPATPTAGSNGPICAGQTLNLAGLPNGLTYSWTGPNGFTSTSQNPSIAAATTAAGGTYSLTVNSLGCNSPAGTLAVVVNPTPLAPTAGGTSTLCVGSTINLTSTNPGGATWSWTGPNGFTSALQNPSIAGASTLATGMYSVTVTVGGCTSLPGTQSVSVFGNPPAPTLGANSPVCTGQTLSLTASSILGASYSWTGPNGFTSSLQNPFISNVTLPANGTYSVGVNVSGCGSSASTLSVVVNATPAAPTALNNSAICAGSTLNFTANPSGGIYNWTGPNSFTSTSQNPSIPGASTLATGMYSVTITVNGCASAAGTTSATVNPIPAAPTAGGTSPLCAGQTINLTANPGGATYNWSGPNSFTSTLQNPTISNASTSASGSYSVTQTLLGCTGPVGVVSITVNPIPSAPVAGNNAPLCALQTLSLTAGNGGTSYSWTGPNGFSSSAQNPTISPVTVAASGNYSVTQTILGCTSPAAITNVTINPAAPTPTVTSNSPICLNQTLNLTQTAIASATYSWSGPNGFTSSTQNPSIVNTQTIATGVYSVFANVAGCPGLTSTVSILVSQPGTVNPGSSPTVCANNSTVFLNGVSSTGSGTWISSGSGSFSPNNLTGNYVPSASDISAGNITFTLTSTNNGGCVAVTNTLNAFITPAPTASAGANQTVCANNATVSLNGAVTIASGGIWSSSGTGTFVPNNTALTASYVPSPADISSGTFTLTLTTTGNGNCFAVSNPKVITISPAPVVNPGPNPQFVCTNNPNYQLLGTSTTGNGMWASSGTGTFSNPNILSPIYFSTPADTVAGSITLTLTSTGNGGCLAVSQTVTLIYTSTLTVSAGGNQIVCSNTNVNLNGVSTTSAGVWTSSGSGVFSPSSNSLATSYVPSAADISSGLVTLTLTSANNGGCNPVKSVMTVTITPGPTANAGSSQTVCANNASVALSGSVTVASGVSWSSSGSGTFSPNNTTTTPVYIASAADTTAGNVIITLSSTGNGSCSASTSTINISFSPAPLVIAGSTVSVCKNNPVAVLNGYSSTGSGTWTTMGTGTLSSASVLSPTYTPSTADTTAGFVNLILTSTNNGGCNLVRDTVLVIFSSPPTVTAGITQTVCANNSTVTLNGTSSTGSGTWTTSGNGSFAPNTINGSYIPGNADISAGVVTLTLTTTNNGGCNSVLNTTTINISPAPTALAGTDQTVCANSGTINLAGSFSISAGATWSASGTGTFTPNNSSMNSGYIPSVADTSAGSVMIFLTTTGNGNCLQVTDTMKITFIRSPYINAGSDLNLCPNSPSPLLTGVSTAGTGSWTTLGSGSFSPNNTILNPTYIPSAADQSAGSVTLVLTSGTVTCGSGSDTLVVNFKPKPTAAFTYTNKCLGSVTGFTNAATTPSGTIVSWLWYFNTDTSTIKNPVYTFTASGTQTVSLVVSNGSCTDSIIRSVYINRLPTSLFTHTVMCHDSVRYVRTASVTPGGIANWNWDFGDTQTLTAQNPYHVYADTGIYVVTLQVKSDSGCVNSISDSVHVRSCANDLTIGAPAVPTGFTPNGDGGNDVLFVKGGPYKTLDFRIFNEWGNQIFHSDIQSSGWDGTFKSAPQPVGRFIWTLTGELIDGRKIKMAGEVILNR
ncbi:MAG: gliding motility-associated C-terminal domain-containing protein [Bacteroidetes bacterium]|nr:gliding motility-associated C-terminal domain-containing protein [Bacteroidota bacterium]